MAMHNPPHPGEFITEVYLKPNEISGRELAATLGVAASTLNRIPNSASDLWHARRSVKLGKIGKPGLSAA